MDGRYNTRSPAVKRLMREAQELSEPTDQYFAQPLDDNLFEWHFTIRGPADSDFQNGIYHGRIILPVDYPMKPPSIIWLTPNGRFETCKKICLSISGHHPESWQPSWSIRTALLAIIGFMPTHPGGAIGSLDYTPEERKTLAKKSKDWKCPTCGEITNILLEVSATTQATSDEAKELAAQINLQGEKPKSKEQGKLAETSTKPASENSAIGVGQNATNTATNIQQQQQQQEAPPSLPSPFPNQPGMPQFPQWSPLTNGFPMPPVGFPFQYPGMPPMAPMQFPYPPSHYPATHQFPWPPAPGMGMYPNSFHPTPVSVNNTSSQENGIRTDFSSNKNTPYSRTPMSCPVVTQRSHQSTSNNTVSAESSNPKSENKETEESKSNRGHVFEELLSKVNRVGSSTGNINNETPTLSSDKQEQSGVKALSTPSKQRRSEHIGTRQKSEEGDDSEVSTKSQKKTGGSSIGDMGDASAADDNSESDIPPIEVDRSQSPGLEKGACSSTSELEKWKQKYQMTKGVRQRQSATASISPEVTEEGVSAEPERPETGTRQRIEAVSGDTVTRNRSRQIPRLVINANIGNRPENERQVRQGSYDVGFYLMVGLFTTSMLILFNRLASMDWSDWQ